MTKRKYRYRTKVKRVYSRARASVPMKNVMDGVFAGVVSGVASNWLGGWGSPVGKLAIGWWRRNSTLSTMAGIEFGNMISGVLPFGGSGSSGGGFFE